MGILRKILSLLWPPAPATAPPPQVGSDRLHLFSGHFRSEETAMSYCYDTPDDNHPEPLTRDLADAYIDTNFVEVAFGGRAQHALHLILPANEIDAMNDRRGEDNTLVMISEAAFGGLPYTLNDMPTLRYLGAFTISS